MKKIVCGKENINSFNREFKAVAPGFHDLAKQLHAAGLIDGLRGVTLEVGDFSLQPVIDLQPKPEAEAAKQCQDCGHWVRDSIGFGAGIGECLLNSRPTLLKWPEQAACDLFEATA